MAPSKSVPNKNYEGMRGLSLLGNLCTAHYMPHFIAGAWASKSIGGDLMYLENIVIRLHVRLRMF